MEKSRFYWLFTILMTLKADNSSYYSHRMNRHPMQQNLILITISCESLLEDEYDASK